MLIHVTKKGEYLYFKNEYKISNFNFTKIKKYNIIIIDNDNGKWEQN